MFFSHGKFIGYNFYVNYKDIVAI